MTDPGVDLLFGKTGDPESEGNIVVNIQMGKKGIILEDRVDLPFIGRDIIDQRTVEIDLAAGRRLESADDPERRCLSASGRIEQRHKGLVPDAQIDGIQDTVSAEIHRQVF